MNIYEEIQKTIKVLDSAQTQERVEFFKSLAEFYCPHCGDRQLGTKQCQCLNDE